ncbi:MAG: Luciferase-like monooxygenase [Acidimicrobiales bacterium]|nr:Luciferase-like monooxygenase [Acidimicrobiales bacterium]
MTSDAFQAEDAIPMSDRPLRLGWWLSSEEHDPRALVEHAVLAESIGLETAIISDHLQPWSRHQSNASYVWTVLGGIAHATDRIEVGTGVTAMVHRQHPIGVAQAAATAAVMLEDRFFLGVGAGERLNEQPYGERWSRTGERRQWLEEAIEVIRRLFAGDTVNHRGDHWSVENLALMTLPASAPPIYVAASGKLSAKSAGQHGDGLIGVAPDPNVVDVFRGSGGAGKPCLGQLHVSIAADVDAARRQAWEWWPNGVIPPTVLGELAKPADFESVAEAVGPESIGDLVVCASGPEPIVEAVDRFVGAGYDTVYLHQVGPDQQRLADMLSAELLPHYQRPA